MSSIFTDFLRTLEGRSSPPDPDTFDHLWQALRGVLIREMKRRSAWSSPPSFLGVFGQARWTRPNGTFALHGDGGGDGDALEELLAECYSFIFVDRLRALQAQLRVRPNVDGLIFLNIRHFLHDTQKRFDPLGFRVFEVVQTAVRRLIATGELHVVEGDPRVRNETILSFRRGCDPTEAESAQPGEQVLAWMDELLPGLVTARGKELEQVLEQLSAHLLELGSRGVSAFLFKDLVDAFKTDVRARWAAIFDGSQGESTRGIDENGDRDLSTIVRIVRPDSGFEQRDRLEKLIDCVEHRLERFASDSSTTRHLTRLWRFLCSQTVESSENHGAGGSDGSADGERLSRRKLATLLHIPRDRMTGLFHQLGQLLEGCRELPDPSRPGRSEEP